jgi:hypothetical protein
MLKTLHPLRRCAVRWACSLAVLAAGVAHAGLIEGAGSVGGGGLGAPAVNSFIVNPDGVGHNLIVPVYSAQGDYGTILNLVNTDAFNGKAVKVRFRGAANADTVFDMTVFLAPGDVWNGLVNRNPSTGIAQFSTEDSTCTLPALAKGVPQSFSTARTNPSLSASERANHTREGYIEIITMADIPPVVSKSSLHQSISAKADASRDCAAPAVLATQFDTTSESVAAGLGFASPNGSLSATWAIINVPQTLTFSGTATALLGINTQSTLTGRGNYVFFPQSDATAGLVDTLTGDPLLRSSPAGNKTYDGLTRAYQSASLPLVKPLMKDLPDLSTPYVSGGLSPSGQASMISRLLTVRTLRNTYTTEPSVGAATDWIVSYPMRRFSVALEYVQGLPAYSLLPGEEGYEYFSSDNTTLKDGKVCMGGGFNFFDRAQSGKSSGDEPLVTSSVLSLCGAVSTLSFGAAPPSVLGANISLGVTGTRAFVNGWGSLDLTNGYFGTPVLGASFIKVANPSASPGVSGTYGITQSHKFLR